MNKPLAKLLNTTFALIFFACIFVGTWVNNLPLWLTGACGFYVYFVWGNKHD